MKPLSTPELARFQSELKGLLEKYLRVEITNWVLLAGNGLEIYTNRFPVYLYPWEMRARLLSLLQEVEYSRVFADNPKVRFICGDGTWIEVDLSDLNKRPPEEAPRP